MYSEVTPYNFPERRNIFWSIYSNFMLDYGNSDSNTELFVIIFCSKYRFDSS